MLVEAAGEYHETKRCEQCGCILLDSYQEDICPRCKEANLFSEVKDYIRANDVREMDVAEHFDIPIGQVRRWIREGRIQYRGEDGKTLSGVHCQICGKAIDFGTVCSECHRLEGLKVVAQKYADAKSSMRFLDKDKK